MLGGIVAFLVVEKFVRFLRGGGHGHSHGPAVVEEISEKVEKVEEKEECDDKDEAEVKTGKFQEIRACIEIIFSLLFFITQPE